MKFERNTMTRRNRMKGILISLACVVGVLTAPAAAADGDRSSAEPEAIELEVAGLEAARAKLDEAAGKFADHVAEYVGGFDWHQSGNRPFLGIIIAHQDADGIRVASVTPGGGAEEAGIRAEDLIVRVNDADLTGSGAPVLVLHDALERVNPGEKVKVKVLRAGKPLAVDVVSQPRAVSRMFSLDPGTGHPLAMDGWWGRDNRRREHAFGFKLVDIGETMGAYFGVDAGVLVLTAEDENALLPGDIVQRVGNDDVADAEATYLALAEAEKSTQVVVRRNGKRKTLTMEPIKGVRVRKLLEFSD